MRGVGMGGDGLGEVMSDTVRRLTQTLAYKRQPQETEKALRQYGVSAKVATELSQRGSITPDMVHSEVRKIRADKSVTSVPGVLVKHLRQIPVGRGVA